MAEKTSKSAVLIPIVNQYRFSVDRFNNHTLYFREKKQVQEFGKRGVFTGEEKEVDTVIGYYNTMEGLLNALVRDAAYRKIDAGEIKSVKDYLNTLKETTDRIETITGGY